VLLILMQCPPRAGHVERGGNGSSMSVRVMRDMRKGVGQYFVLYSEDICYGD